MINSIVARGAFVSVSIISLMGLGAMSTVLANGQGTSTTVVDTTSAYAKMQVQLNETRKELDRAHEVLEYSARYVIPADLSAMVYDNAVAEGISPSIGFRLVQTESNFSNSAASNMGAIGLTQLRLMTARGYDTKLDPSDLMNPQVNLKIGFRYLKDLLKQFDNDQTAALEAYNKGPTYVVAQQKLGTEVRGKYSDLVLKQP